MCVHLLVFFLIKVSRPICAFDLPHYILHSLDNRGLDVGRRKRKARTGECDKTTLSLRSRNGSLYLGWKIKKKKRKRRGAFIFGAKSMLSLFAPSCDRTRVEISELSSQVPAIRASRPNRESFSSSRCLPSSTTAGYRRS